MQLQQDTLFDNRYTLRQLIGRGGFSEVWLAHDTWTELDIAIKVYAPGQGMDTNGLQIFSKELAGVFNLNQANLLKPTHVGQWLNMPYLIMEYCPKGALNKQVGKLTEQEVWKVLHDVAAGLAYLHAKEIVHQDIKPDNILLDENGVYRITDFGISTKARTTLRRSIGAAAVSGGTTAYMAPERFSANPAPTKASDIWSLGAMVFELITGDVPFGEIGGGLQKNGADIPTIHPAKGVLSAELTHVVRLMLAPNAWDRPTADTLAAWASNPLTLNFAADSSNVNTPKAGANEGQKAGGSRTTSKGVPNNPSGTTSKDNTSKGGSRETTILKPGSSSTKGTTTTERHTPHEPKPTVVDPKPTVVHLQPLKDERGDNLWRLWWLWVIIGSSILATITGIVIPEINNTPTTYSNQNNESASRAITAQLMTNTEKNINAEKAKELISKICSNSSRGGNYASLEKCFTYTIAPYVHSGLTKYNYEMPEATKKYVQRFPKYQISTPYNLCIINSSFPAIVQCDVTVDWIIDGKKKHAVVHKTYYITSDYKVSGFLDQQDKTQIIGYVD